MLVTGATGFIGSAVAKRLDSLGAFVTGTARRQPASRVIYKIWLGALEDIGDCRTFIESAKPDVIIHTAGHPFAARDLARVVPTFRDNLQATVSMLTAAAEAKVSRVVLCGSLEEPESGNPEEALSSPYSVSKWAASAYARLFHRLYQLPVVTARLFMVYGPGQADFTKLIPGSIVKLLRGEAPQIASGDRPVDWTFVDDIVDGMIAAAAAPGVEGETVDIGTGHLTTVRRIVEMLAELIPGSPAPRVGSVAPRPDEQVRAARAERTRSQINWAPAVNVREGLQRTIEWVRANPPAAA